MSGNRRESTNARPAGEEPPYLTVGTEVSAKYRGAFCEANIKSVKKMVKCKVTFDKGNGSSTVTDDCINGVLKVGSDVEVKLPDGQDITGTLVKITDSSAYTVVFDDGDERTLKRTSLCLKGEKHFNESETLDHLPLTDPENFGTPVMQQGKKSKRGRRHSTSVDADKGKETDEMPARKKLVQSEENVDQVVMVDITEKKKTFHLPALRVPSVGSCYGELKSPENVLVRSFKDGKYIEVHPKDVKEFSKESVVNSSFPKAESVPLKLAVEHAVKYLETKQLPSDWNEQSSKPDETPKSCNSHSSSDDGSEEDEKERDEFMASLTKFLEEKGTPLVRSPVLAHRDLDLYKLFRIVSQMNGMDKIESWQSVYLKMDTPVVTTTGSYHIKNAYKRYLFDYEQHQREKELKKILAESKKCGKNDKSSTKPSASTSTNAAAAKQKEETQSKSDSDKDSKELNLSDDNKLLSHGKTSRAARAKTKRELAKARTERTKSLKSPPFPDLSPKSPCSPRSLSSVSASGSTGCPSPFENSCDSRELRTKTAAEPACCKASKNNEKALNEAEVDVDVKADVSRDDKTREQDTGIEDVKDTLGDITRNEIKVKACKNNGRRRKDNGSGVEVKSGELVKDKEVTRDDAKDDVEMNDVKMDDVEKNDAKRGVVKKDDVKKDDVGNDDVKKDAVKKDDAKKEDIKNGDVEKEDVKKGNVKKEDVKKEDGKREDGKREDVKKGDGKREDVKKEDVKKGDGKREDVKKEDIKKSCMKEEVEEKMEQDDDDEPEDAVDVVNSPSGTSGSVDSDVGEEEKADKKTSGGKTEAAEKIGGKGQGASNVGCKLEYRLNDRIDVRYGRGRNATIYHAKITSVDPAAEEQLYYLVHYAGWNARHDEWIGHERIIGRDQKQTRTRASKEARNNKPPPKTTIKPTPKPIANKNGAVEKQAGKLTAGKNRKRTPSPTPNVAPNKNGNGKASKSRNEKVTVDSLDLAGAIKCQPRVTRHNSLSTPTDAPETNLADQRSQDAETEREEVVASSPPPAAPSDDQPSPKCEAEISDSTTENYEEPAEMEVDEDPCDAVVKIEDTPVETSPDEETVDEEVDVKVNVETTLKRPHEDEVDESPPAKRKHEEDDSSEAVFEEEEERTDCMKQAEDSASPEPKAAIDDANTPDLTCTEQLSTNCDSPNPYTGEYPRNDVFFSNGIGGEELGSETKEKDSSSSVDESKSDKSPNRKSNCRRERKTRASSSQSSYEGSEYPNGSSNGTSGPIMPSPTRTAKYNFTEDLDELLKKEESSERIRLLQEKIKGIRKVYGELKSEVANIDRKRKRRQKRKREEELSTEEGSARSPSRSSPLSTTNEENTAPAANTPPAVECR